MNAEVGIRYQNSQLRNYLHVLKSAYQPTGSSIQTKNISCKGGHAWLVVQSNKGRDGLSLVKVKSLFNDLPELIEEFNNYLLEEFPVLKLKHR